MASRILDVYGPGFSEGSSCRWAQQDHIISALSCESDTCKMQWHASPAPMVPWAVCQGSMVAAPGSTSDPRGMQVAYAPSPYGSAGASCTSCMGPPQ